MFKKLVKSVFSSTDKGFTPDYESFERSRQTANSQQETGATVQLQTQAVPKAGPFYDYLFGDSNKTAKHDPLSIFVSNKINQLIANPELLLADLPVMPASVAKVISLLENDGFDLPEMLKVIEQEPVVAADVIKLANSAKYKRGDKQITDLHRAFMCMGADGLQNGVLQSYIKKFSASSNLYFKQFGEKIWAHSFNSAQYSQKLAEHYLSSDEANTVYLVGLVRNIGAMIIFQLMLEAFKHVDPDARPNSANFKWLMADQSLNLTIAVAKHWNLPARIIDMLAVQTKDAKDQVPGALSVFEANIISEVKSLLDGRRITSETYQKYLEAKLVRDYSKQFALSLLPEPINS